VGSAASLFQRQPQWSGSETRTFRVVVSAGTVGVTMRDPARRERNALTALGTDSRGTTAVYAPPAVEVHGVRYSGLADSPEWQDPYEHRDSTPARQVAGWSRRSRSRMTRTLAQIDWTPMYDRGRAAAMVTLTYPGDWLTVAPTGRAVKRHLTALWKRWERQWGTRPQLVWKLEFQRRGAPHVHCLAVPPAGPGKDGRLFRDWLSHAWAEVVGHPDPVQRSRHLAAGTGVDYVRGARCFDPKRAAVYFAKHGGAAGGKEYQHEVPAEWQEQGKGPGRFWGRVGLDVVTAEVDVSVRDYVQMRRTLRRWSEAQDLTRDRRVPRVNTATGELRSRKVRRRTRYIGQGGLQGGTVLVNDGPAFASALARLIPPQAP
jgi:hypothetical protein